MTLNEYQKIAMRNSPSGHDRIRFGILGLIGMSGEMVDTVRKMEFWAKETSAYTGKIHDNVGDVLWYCAELATGLGTDLETAMLTNYKSAMRDGEIDDPLEKAVIRLAELSVKTYTYGLRRNDRRNMMICMRRIYATILRILKIIHMDIQEVIRMNLQKQADLIRS